MTGETVEAKALRKAEESKFLEWSIDSRRSILQLIHKLYVAADLDSHRKIILEIDEKHLRRDIGFLFGAGFSLWRACFLANDGRKVRRIVEDEIIKDKAQRDTIFNAQLEFFKDLMQDNSISYSNDKRNRSWTCRYYINNSAFRIKYAKDESVFFQNYLKGNGQLAQRPGLSESELEAGRALKAKLPDFVRQMTDFDGHMKHYLGWNDPRTAPENRMMWDHSYAALVILVDVLTGSLQYWDKLGPAAREGVLGDAFDTVRHTD